MPPRLQIAPSIAAADLSRLGWAVEVATKAGADMIHLDLEDGVFLPNLTFGPAMIRALRPHSSLPFDVHVELDRPESHLEEIAQAGADRITVHAEACPYLYRVLRTIRALGKIPGVAFNAATSLEKVRQARRLIADRPIDLQVDGGLQADHVREVVTAGANVLVVGRAVWAAGDPSQAILALRRSA